MDFAVDGSLRSKPILYVVCLIVMDFFAVDVSLQSKPTLYVVCLIVMDFAVDGSLRSKPILYVVCLIVMNFAVDGSLRSKPILYGKRLTVMDGRYTEMLAKLRSEPSLWRVVRTSFTMADGNSEFANFILPTLKVFLEARSQNVCDNKQ